MSTTDCSLEFYPIPVRTSNRRKFHRRPIAQDKPDNLCYPTVSTDTDLDVTEGYGTANLQSSRRTPFQPTPPCRLNFLALTETWITQENTATPAALSSVYSFSHSLIQTGQREGTGLLISPTESYQVHPLDHLPRSGFEFHVVSVTLPFILNIVGIYRPPGPLWDFFDEMDALLNCSPAVANHLLSWVTSTSPKRSCTYLNSLTSSPLLTSHSPCTHWAWDQLDLVFKSSCSTWTPSITLLTVSDHHAVSLSP